MMHELVLVKERKCVICKATDVFILCDPIIVRNFLITRLDKDLDSGNILMSEYWRYANHVGAEIYPTIIMGLPEIEYYPFFFHIWKKGKPKPVEISEDERKRLQELKKQILEMDGKLEDNARTNLHLPYSEWKETFGLKEVGA